MEEQFWIGEDGASETPGIGMSLFGGMAFRNL